ncbi:hypothetical protein AKJ16_DCAP03624 [Drosera capensis]
MIPSYFTDLLRILRAHKQAFKWKIADIKGIAPSMCMHKILMEERYRPLVQPQRRLNPIMQEVIKNEVIKLLDADQLIRRCVPKEEMTSIIHHCHDREIGGHFETNQNSIQAKAFMGNKRPTNASGSGIELTDEDQHSKA